MLSTALFYSDLLLFSLMPCVSTAHQRGVISLCLDPACFLRFVRSALFNPTARARSPATPARFREWFSCRCMSVVGPRRSWSDVHSLVACDSCVFMQHRNALRRQTSKTRHRPGISELFFTSKLFSPVLM